jgi:hypothetical protein
MSSDIQKEGKNYSFKSVLVVSGTTPTRIILWLTAIAIVSFAIGFGILALSGAYFSSADHSNSPFKHTAWLTPMTTAIPLEGAATGNISVTMGAGELTLTGGASNSDLIELTVFSQAPEWQPEFSSTQNDTIKTVRITDKGHTGKTWFAVDSPNSWEIRLSDQVPIAADVRIGAGDCRLNLGTLNLTSLNVHAGAGDTEIDFSRYHGGRFDAVIMHGIGDLTLRIPGSGNTRITVDQGVGDIAETGFKMNNGAYVTAGFNPDLPVNEITVKQGVGDVRIEMV